MNRLLHTIRLHRFLIAFAVIYTAIVVFTALALGGDIATLLGFMGYLSWGILSSCLFFIILMVFYLWRALKTTPRGGKWFTNVMTAFENSTVGYLRSERFTDGVAGLLILFPVSFFFCIAKALIPTVHGYNMDPMLSLADHWVHFGHFPHNLISPWIERHDLTRVVDSFYVTWFMVVFIVLEYAIFVDGDQNRRMRFMWTYCLLWVIAGNIMALAMASVGPLFSHDFYTCQIDPYMNLVDHLQAQDKLHHLEVIAVAKLEMDFTKSGQIINLNALSAMPSMHVGVAVLMALYFTKVNRKIAAALFVYFVLMLISSVYLGWHYAIDGYMATIVTWLIWRASGPLVKKLHPEFSASET